MFKCKGCEVLREETLLLRTLLSDAEGRAAVSEQANREQINSLLNKILALSNPVALSVLPENKRSVPQTQPAPPSRPHYPGYRPDLRPSHVEPLVTKTLEDREQEILKEAPRTLADYKVKSTLHEAAVKKN